MIELKRLKLINWHNFENTTFDCARLTYMIGVNAVGKTTILDAIRYCLTTNRNFNAFWQTVVRALLLGICAVPMITLPPADLTRCMNQLHCPRIITLGMLVTLRFIPILVTEIRRIWEAMRVRGANVKWYRPDCLYRAFFIPLVMRIIGISDTLSLSLETRAFALDNSPATVYGKVELRARDIIFLVAVIISCAGLGVAAWMR